MRVHLVNWKVIALVFMLSISPTKSENSTLPKSAKDQFATTKADRETTEEVRRPHIVVFLTKKQRNVRSVILLLELIDYV
ncbi:hypothetical protein KIN20_008782 [Parelaphostrongylus tenuis]|uniref:Uncharacterized protein n=1 Tax=Parelaphostrongylus tenuis TaxID=148309 RepID=A0AAD5QJ63_PARTN|nr:hypothetical protein KIN20_008782 [Parelaphostrongylus tenuis]